MSEITKKQKEEVDKLFGYDEGGVITDAELERAKEIFTQPSDFNLLRKLLGRYTQDERGISLQSEFEGIVADSDEEFGKAAKLIIKVDEKIKERLLIMYQLIRSEKREDLSNTFKAENEEKVSEDKVREDLKEEKSEGKKKVGDNL